MVRIFIPDLPEFLPVLDAARKSGACRIIEPVRGYWRIEADTEIRFERKPLGLGPALWNSALAGGFSGKIVQYDRDVLRIVGEE